MDVTYRHTRGEPRSDSVASLDAFNVTRWPNDHAAPWHVHALNPWSLQLAKDYITVCEQAGDVDAVPRALSGTGWGFGTRTEARDWIDDVAKHGTRWT